MDTSEKKKNEDIHDDVVFVDGDWNENAAVFKQKDLLDTVLALDADNVVPNDEVLKEIETAVVESEAVDFPEVNVDRKDEVTLSDVVTKRCWFPQREHLRPGGVLIASRRARAGCAL